jgi:MoxR-like ATPase
MPSKTAQRVALPLTVTGKGECEVQPGPILANLILADEINRAPAKVQSALLEAMEENGITSRQSSPLYYCGLLSNSIGTSSVNIDLSMRPL